jgi:FMN-dependent NADH-azoreductase
MTTLLHIDSSIQGERSVTCELTKAIVADLRSKQPDLQVKYVNLATKPLTHLTLDLLPSDHPLAGAGVGDPADPHGRLAGKEALDVFLAADYSATIWMIPRCRVSSAISAAWRICRGW